MRVPLRANDARNDVWHDVWIRSRRRLRGLAVLGAAMAWSGCGDDRRPRAHDADTAAHDSQPHDAPVDSELPVHDGGAPQDADAGAGSHRPVIDGGTEAAAVCPPWRRAPAAGHAWLHARAVSTGGVVLTPDVNHVDIYVRRASEPLPGERADPNDPCAVASYNQSTARVQILAAAVGFSSQERTFSPQQCLETSPCLLELPQSLNTKYYRVQANRMSLVAAGDVPPSERTTFAAAVANDALARSKRLRKPLSQELEQAAKVTKVPAVDLAIQYAEAKLGKKCDARCLDDRKVDVNIRTYLKTVRRPRTDPFELRTPPDKWPTRTR
jgi:hypothetical protein